MHKPIVIPGHWHDRLISDTLPWLMAFIGLLMILVWGFLGLLVAQDL
jgi:hypothetical protein